MSISRPKTKIQHIRNRPRVGETTEEDIENLPDEKNFKFECSACKMTYSMNHGLAVHKGRWCKGKVTKRKPSRKGTVTDKIVQQIKVVKYLKDLLKVKMGEDELDDVYSFEYLGAEIAADGNQQVTFKHRCDI